MSDRMECAGCGAETSTVLTAFNQGRACPYCGLSAASALEIEAVRRTRADEKIKTKLEAAIKRADLAERAARTLRRILAHVWDSTPEEARHTYLYGSLEDVVRLAPKDWSDE